MGSLTAMLEMLRECETALPFTDLDRRFETGPTETTLHPDAIAEMALAHTIRNKAERAYRRGDAFDRRRDLMQQWCNYLLGDPQAYREK